MRSSESTKNEGERRRASKRDGARKTEKGTKSERIKEQRPETM